MAEALDSAARAADAAPGGRGDRIGVRGPTRVLFLRHDRAGDMILSTGVMRAIAASHTTITLDVLASPINASWSKAPTTSPKSSSSTRRRSSSYLPTALRLRRARYDAVIDCMVTAPSVTTLLLILASGARYRVGIAGRGNDAAFNVTVPNGAERDAHGRPPRRAVARLRRRAQPRTRAPVLTVTATEREWAVREWGGRCRRAPSSTSRPARRPALARRAVRRRDAAHLDATRRRVIG